MEQSYASINGTLTTLADARIPARDRGLQYGDGLFETMRALDGSVCFLEEHLARLTNGMVVLGIPAEGVELRVRAGMRQVLAELASTPVCYVKAIVTRGTGPGGPTMKGAFTPTVAVIAAADDRERGTPVRAVTSTVVRNERSALANVKSLNYTEMLLARGEAQDAGVDEAIVLNTHGRVAEASAANVFALQGSVLLSPANEEGCLPGIVRNEVVALAKREGIGVSLGQLTPAILAAADEAFLTNSGIGVAALVELDGSEIGNGARGNVTMRLAAAYEKVERESATSP